MGKHVNPKSRNGQRSVPQKTGNARRGNANAAQQARDNLNKAGQSVVRGASKIVNDVKSRSGNTPTVSNSSNKSSSKPKNSRVNNLTPNQNNLIVNADNLLRNNINNVGFQFRFSNIGLSPESKAYFDNLNKNKRSSKSLPQVIRNLYDRAGLDQLKDADIKPQDRYNPYRDARKHDEEARERILANTDQQANIAVSLRMTQSPTIASAFEMFSSRSINDIDKEVNYWETVINPKNNKEMDLVLNYIGIYDTGEKNENGEPVYGLNEGIDQDIAIRRMQMVNDWYRNNVSDRAFIDWNSSKEIYMPQVREYDPTYVPRDPSKKPSPPPWVASSPEVEESYEFYTKYSNRSRQVEVETFADMQERQAEIEEAGIKGEVGIGMSHFGEEGVVDSVTDLLTANTGAMINRGSGVAGLRNYYKTIWNNTKNYFRDYWWNPIRTGHMGTFVWNRVAGVIDALDYVPRYARAVGASKTEIGGMWDSEEGNLFNGQKVFWYKDDEESRAKQEFFMKNGGRELLHAVNPSHVTEEYGSSYSDKDKFIAQLKKAFAESDKYDENDWLEVYNGIQEGYDDARKGDRKQLIENLIKVATTPGADFNADSGSLATDVLVETVFDPTLFIGGLAGGAFKSGIKDTARSAVSDGFKAVRKSDAFYSNSFVQSIAKPGGKGVIASPFKLEGLSKDQVKRANAALRRFERRNDSKNILFKNKKALEQDSRFLALELNKIDRRILQEQDIDVFVKRVTKSITEPANNANAKIMSSMDRLSPDLLKAAYYIDKGANGFDMALLKGALPEYFLTKGVYKGGRWLFNSSKTGRMIKARKLTKKLDKWAAQNGMSHFTDEATVKDIMDAIDEAKHSSREARQEINADNRIRIENLTVSVESIIRDLGEQRLTPDEAQLTLQEAIRSFSGSNDYTTFDELEIYLKNHPEMLDGDALEAFTVLRSSHDELIKFIDNSRKQEYVDMVSGTHTNEQMSTRGVLNTLRQMEDNDPNISIFRTHLRQSNMDRKYLIDRCGVDLDNFPSVKALFDSKAKVSAQEILDVIPKDIIQAQIKNIDTVQIEQMLDYRQSLYNDAMLRFDRNEVVYQMQIDRLAFFDTFIHSAPISQLEKIYDRELKPLLDEVFSKSCDDLDYVTHQPLYEDLRAFRSTMENLRTFNLLMAKLRPNVSGLTNQQMWVVLDTIFGFTKEAKDMPGLYLQSIMQSIRGTNSPLDIALYANLGESKVGIRNAAARLRSCKSNIRDDIFKNFEDELDADPELQDYIMDIVENSAENAENYCKLQILQAVLLDPSIVKEYNMKSKEQPVIFTHFNTSGLNRNVDSIREASAITWRPINEDKVSLRELFDEVLNNENTIWTKSVKLSPDELEVSSPEFLDKIYDLDSIMHSETHEVKRLRYANKYGAYGDDELYSEEELLSDFLQHINRGNVHITNYIPPSLVVHDYDGFNIPFLTNRINYYRNNGSTKESILQTSLQDLVTYSDNTFERLRSLSGESTFTYDEREYVTNVLEWLSERISVNSENNFDFVNMDHLVNRLSNMVSYVDNVPDNYSTTHLIQMLSQSFQKNSIVSLVQDIANVSTQIRTANQIATNSYVFKKAHRTKISNGMLNTPDVEFVDSLSRTSYNALESICKALNIEFLSTDEFFTDDVAGLYIPGKRSIRYNSDLPIDDFIETFLHELTHHNVRTDFESGKGFYDALAEKLRLEMPNDFDRWIKDKEQQYGTSNVDVLYHELAAQVSSFVLNDEAVFRELIEQAEKIGDVRTVDLLNSFHILVQNHSMLHSIDYDPVTVLERNMSKRLLSDDLIKSFFFDAIVRNVNDSDNLTNLITHNLTRSTTVRDTLKYGDLNSPLLGIKAKSDTFEINSYFDLYRFQQADVSVGVTQQDMSMMQSYVEYINTAKNIKLSRHASEKLEPYFGLFSSIIRSVRNLELTHEALYGMSNISHISFVRYLRDPDNAVDAYLICRRLYDDILKYWLDAGLASDYAKAVNSGTFLNSTYDTYSTRMIMEFVDQFDTSDIMDIINIFDSNVMNDVFDLLCGNHDSELFMHTKNVIHELKGGEKNRYSTGIDLVKKLKSAMSRLRTDHINLRYLTDELHVEGIDVQDDFTLIMACSKLEDFISSLPKDEKVVSDFITQVVDKCDAWRTKYIDFYNIYKLRNSEGVLDEDKLISELLFNHFHHIVYNVNRYSSEQFKEFQDFIDNLNSPYISGHFENGGNQYVVGINNKVNGHPVSVTEEKLPDGSFGMRVVTDDFIGNVHQRNTYEAIPFPEFEEIVSEASDPHMFSELYNQYVELYKDAERLSLQHDTYFSHGSLGHVINQAEFEDYFKKCPPSITDNFVLPELDLRGRVVYDPGFVRSGNQNGLVNLIYTLELSHKTAESGVLAANYMFGSNVPNRFSDLIKDFSDEEVIEVLKDDLDWVVVNIEAANSRYGFNLVEMPMRTAQDVALARDSHAIVLPYEVSKNLQGEVNVYEDSGFLKVLNNMLLIQKAFSLCKLGTVIKNYIDASMRQFANEKYGGPTEKLSMLSYQAVAIKYYNQCMKIIKNEGDNLTLGDWEAVCIRNKVSISYDDFMLFKGMYDANRYSAAPLISNKVGVRHTVSQTQNQSLEGITSTQAWSYLEHLQNGKKVQITIPKSDFQRIYNDGFSEEDSLLLRNQYHDLIEKLYSNLDTGDLSFVNRCIKDIFKPFNTSELLAKYSQLLYMRDNGMNVSERLKNIHFSQAQTNDTNRFAHQMELVFPFVTYTYKTIEFWMDIIEKNPRYYRVWLEHVYGSIFEQNIESSLAENGMWDYEQDYNTNQGGIPIPGLNGIYFKLKPSFFDALETFYGGPSTIFNNKLNAPLRLAARYSLYYLGFNSKDFMGTIDLDMSDELFEEQLRSVIPGVNNVTTIVDNIYGTSSYKWKSLDEPIPRFLVKYLPALFGKRITESERMSSDFNDFQNMLAKQGKFYDCNMRRVVPLRYKNEYGLNDPNLSFEDRRALMYTRYGLVWDANISDWVPVDQLSEGGLNQIFDLDNDPDAWEKLEAEYKKRGKVFDYNVGKFVPREEVSFGGLNDPNADFDVVKALYKEKFGKLYDANQNAFVEPENYIAGGLNDFEDINSVSDWYKLKAYREALFGETYVKEPYIDENGVEHKGRFVQTKEPSVVTLTSLVGTRDYDRYFDKLGIPRLAQVLSEDVVLEDGYLKTKDGKYVLLNDADYNNKVFSNFSSGGGFGFRRGWRHWGSGWRNFKKFTPRTFPRPRFRADVARILSNSGVGKGVVGYALDDYYRFEYNYKNQFRNPKPLKKIYKIPFRMILYPIGGQYNKYSFHQHQ